MELAQQLQLDELVKSQSEFLVRQVDELKPWMESILEKIKNKQEDKTFGRSQIRNLLAAVTNAAGVEEMMLYIQYQMGRDEYANSWRYRIRGKAFGDRLNEILKTIADQAKEIARKAENEVSAHELTLKMLGRFFMYWWWSYTYISTEKSRKNQGNRG
jgi:hypothetical protein